MYAIRSYYESAENNANELNSFDIWYYADNDSLESSIYEIIEENGSQPVDTVKFQRYLSYPETSGMPDEPVWLNQENFSVMTYSQSTYNEIVKAAKDSYNFV